MFGSLFNKLKSLRFDKKTLMPVMVAVVVVFVVSVVVMSATQKFTKQSVVLGTRDMGPLVFPYATFVQTPAYHEPPQTDNPQTPDVTMDMETMGL